MTPTAINYANVLIKQRVEAWAEGLEFDPEEQLLMLLEDKYRTASFTVVDACAEDECLMLKVTTDLWKEPKEFALLRNGSLAW
jgi:hypothetical protein